MSMQIRFEAWLLLLSLLVGCWLMLVYDLLRVLRLDVYKRQELGDVLFQVMLNSQIAKEKGLFSIDDVIGGICEKMVRRHPWVFGGEKINSTEEGEALWARIKMQEKAKKP